MLAAICTAYGAPDVVQLREVETPVPKDKDVLIRIHATTVSSGDSWADRLDHTRAFRSQNGLARSRRAENQACHHSKADWKIRAT